MKRKEWQIILAGEVVFMKRKEWQIILAGEV